MIRIKDLQKSYGEKPVLSHFSHDLPDNGIVCLTGASGRGKTTLLRILAGLETADGGSVTGLSAAKLRLFFKRTVCCPGLQPSRIFAWRSQPGQNDQWESC
ncbi:MAG: ATP-binding cassette domain-containing protein [Oscillospiraceae bacterium]